MKNVCLYFNLHQPNRLKPYDFFKIGHDHFYEDDDMNKDFLDKISNDCYLPMNAIMMENINRLGKNFKFCLSLSGTLIEQMENHRPDVLKSFIELSKTGQVEFIGQTFYHSLAYLNSLPEFERQVKKHIAKIEEHFGQTPKVFRNTGMIYCNDLAGRLENLGFHGVMTEGLPQYLQDRSPNYLYTAPHTKKIKTILKNYKLSADFTHRFADQSWNEYPLTAKKYANWIANAPGDCVNIYMPYETFGQHLSPETGAFDFIKKLPTELKNQEVNFLTASDQVEQLSIKGVFDVHLPVSWRDSEKDLSAWSGNNMQKEAMQKLYSLEKTVISSKDEDLIHVWSKLQTSDHFYYLNTKTAKDGETRDYLSPYDSPYSGYIHYMNALADLEITCKEKNE
jgi:alpha-amylase